MSSSLLANLLPSLTVGNSQTFFYPCAGIARSYTGEVHVQAPVGTAGTMSLMTSHFTLNPGPTPTVNFRKNGANGNQAIIPPANGFTVDSSHTDTLVVGDLICLMYVTTSTSTAVAPSGFNCTFTPSVAPGSQLFQASALNDSTGTAISSATTFFIEVIGDVINPQTVETRVGARTLMGGTAHNYFIYLLTNTSAATVTCSLRKNGTTTLTNTVAIAGTTTGLFQDTSHSDTLAPNDSIYATKTGGTSGSTIALTTNGFWLDYGSSSATDLICATVNSNGAVYTGTALNGWTPIAGNLQNAVSNASPVVSQQQRCPFYATWSNLRIRILTNTITLNSTIISSISGVAGTQAAVITAGVIGAYEDTSHTDSLIPGNTLQSNITTTAGNTGNLTFCEVTTLLTNGAVPSAKVVAPKKRDVKKAKGSTLRRRRRLVQNPGVPRKVRMIARRARKDQGRKRSRRRNLYPFQPVSGIIRRPFLYVQT